MMTFSQINHLRGAFTPPADKSITHRALFLAGMATGVSTIYNPLVCDDTLCTAQILRELGVDIEWLDNTVRVTSDGYKAFREPPDVLWCGNSGTTARLATGMLSGGRIRATLDGDDSLRRRPMRRLTSLLEQLGGRFDLPENDGLPLTIHPANLHYAEIVSPVSSAQIKSAVLLAGLQGQGVVYSEPLLSRNHTELMLRDMGVGIDMTGLPRSARNDGKAIQSYQITLPPVPKLLAHDFIVPGDISSAAIFIAGALMFPGSELTINGVGLNPTRTEFLRILLSWGADITTPTTNSITVKYSKLSGGIIDSISAQKAIDELPLLAALGMFSRDGVQIYGAEELRHKESDRLATTIALIQSIGGHAKADGSNITVYPRFAPTPDRFYSIPGDHRIAMLAVILASLVGGAVNSDGINSIHVSYPEFLTNLKQITML